MRANRHDEAVEAIDREHDEAEDQGRLGKDEDLDEGEDEDEEIPKEARDVGIPKGAGSDREKEERAERVAVVPKALEDLGAERPLGLEIGGDDVPFADERIDDAGEGKKDEDRGREEGDFVPSGATGAEDEARVHEEDANEEGKEIPEHVHVPDDEDIIVFLELGFRGEEENADGTA